MEIRWAPPCLPTCEKQLKCNVILSYYFGSEKDSQLKGNNLSFTRPFCSPSTGKKADVRSLIRSLDETQAWHVSDPVIYPLFDYPVSVTWMPEEKIEITKREEWVRETGRISQHLQKGTLLKNETKQTKTGRWKFHVLLTNAGFKLVGDLWIVIASNPSSCNVWNGSSFTPWWTGCAVTRWE